MTSPNSPSRLSVSVIALVAGASLPFQFTTAYAQSCIDESGRLLNAPGTNGAGDSQPSCTIHLPASSSVYVLAENSYRLTWRHGEPHDQYRQVRIRWQKAHQSSATTDDCAKLQWPRSLHQHWSGSTFIHDPLGYTCVEVYSSQSGPTEILQHVIDNITAKDTSDLLKHQQVVHLQDACALSSQIQKMWTYRTHFDTLSFATSLSSALTAVYDATNPVHDEEFMKQWDVLATKAKDESGIRSTILKGLASTLTSAPMLDVASAIVGNMSFKRNREPDELAEIKERLAAATDLVRDVDMNVNERLQNLGTLSNQAAKTIDGVWDNILEKAKCLIADNEAKALQYRQTETSSLMEPEMTWSAKYEIAMQCETPRSAPPQCTRDIVNLVLSSTALASSELGEACDLLNKVTLYFQRDSQIGRDARDEFLEHVKRIQSSTIQNACKALRKQGHGPSSTDAG